MVWLWKQRFQKNRWYKFHWRGINCTTTAIAHLGGKAILWICICNCICVCVYLYLYFVLHWIDINRAAVRQLHTGGAKPSQEFVARIFPSVAPSTTACSPQSRRGQDPGWQSWSHLFTHIFQIQLHIYLILHTGQGHTWWQHRSYIDHCVLFFDQNLRIAMVLGHL